MVYLTPFKRIHQSIEPLAKRFLSPEKLISIATKFPLSLNSLIIEKMCNQIFKEQIEEGEFNFLNQRKIHIEIIDANLNIGLSFADKSLRCLHFSNAQYAADASLSINTSDAITLLQQQVDPDTLFFQRRLKISGDTELAHHIKNTIDTIDPDVIPSSLISMMNLYQRKVL